MAQVADAVFDAALNAIKNDAEQLYICSAEPANYAGIAAVLLGNKASPAITGPADRSGGGREITFTAITDGSITADGTASHVVVADVTGTLLLFSKALSSTQVVTNGNPFTLNSFKVGFPDPA